MKISNPKTYHETIRLLPSQSLLPLNLANPVTNPCKIGYNWSLARSLSLRASIKVIKLCHGQIIMRKAVTRTGKTKRVHLRRLSHPFGRFGACFARVLHRSWYAHFQTMKCCWVIHLWQDPFRILAVKQERTSKWYTHPITSHKSLNRQNILSDEMRHRLVLGQELGTCRRVPLHIGCRMSSHHAQRWNFDA